jgi:D-Tyr-tRNAtyr deacylase
LRPLPTPRVVPSLTKLSGCEAIIQRVLSASVTVDKEVISSIGKGVLVFAAVAPGDTEKEVNSVASKVLKMKLWDDEAGGRVSLSACGRDLSYFVTPLFRLSADSWAWLVPMRSDA